MKKLLLLGLFCLISLIFSGCMAAIINDMKMTQETDNVKDYKNDTINDPTKVDLFLYMSKLPYTNHVLIFADGNYTTLGEPLSFSYYLYFQAEPGVHWFNVKDFSTTSTYYLCKDIKAGTKEIIDLAYPTKNVTSSDMDIKKSNTEATPRLQVKQKGNELSSAFDYNGSITSANIEISPNDNKTLNLLKKTIEKNFEKLSIQKGNDLTIKISIPDNVTYSRLNANTKLEIVRLEFFNKDEKIYQHAIGDYFDERYSNDSDYSLATRITSYISCKYFRKQYPIYK